MVWCGTKDSEAEVEKVHKLPNYQVNQYVQRNKEREKTSISGKDRDLLSVTSLHTSSVF